MKLASVTAMVTPMLSADTGTAVRIGARANNKIIIKPRIDGGFHFAFHFRRRNHAFASQHAATLRAHLIFDHNGGNACAFKFHHRAAHIQRIAITRVGIGKHRQTAGLRHRACIGGIFSQSHNAHIWHAKLHGRRGIARTHECFKSFMRDEPRRKGIAHGRDHGDLLARDQFAKARRRPFQSHVVSSTLELLKRLAPPIPEHLSFLLG
jgi:hypothetical protein